MQVFGKVKVSLNGDILRSKPEASLNLGLVKRTAVPNSLGRVDYKEEHTNSEVKCTLLHVADTELADIEAMTNVNLQFIGDNGVTYMIPDAFFAEAGTLNQDGEIEITFQGSKASRSA